MQVINLTPHVLNLFNENNEEVMVIPPSGQVARVRTESVLTGGVAGIPTFETKFGEVEGLPEPQEGTIFVVSGLVRGHETVRNRQDVFQPGRLLRNESGQPVGCVGLTR